MQNRDSLSYPKQQVVATQLPSFPPALNAHCAKLLKAGILLSFQDEGIPKY